MLLLLPFSIFAQGDLQLSGGVINTANDFQVGHENWARVKFQIDNKSNRERHVKIQFKHASVPGGVYEYEMSIPATTRINHQFPVAMGSAAHISKKDDKKKGKKKKKKINKVDNTYKLILLEQQNGRFLPVNGVKPVECVMDFRNISSKPAFAMFTDESVEIGNMSRKLGHGDSHYRMTYIHKGRWPEHWSEYSPYDALIFLDPLYDDLHPLALQAVKDYVKMGGTVIFAHHNGINNAANTQFEGLLPITPIGNREINTMPSLDKFLGSKEIYHEFGMTFVDSVAKEGAFVPVKWNEFPIIAWKKYGLGIVGAITISPTQEGFQNSDAFAKCWSYLLSHIQRPADMSLLPTNHASESVNMLNGLTIPGPEVIVNYMIVYLVILLILFAACYKFKKAPIAWVLSILISIGMTAFIFKQAYGSSDGAKARTAAVFSQIPIVGDAPAVEVYSVFSKTDDKIDFKGEILKDRFRKLPKVKRNNFGNQNAGAYKATAIQEVITGSYNGQSSILKGLSVQGLSVRVFTKLSRAHNSFIEPINLKFTPDGITLNSSEYPAELTSAEHIYLCGPSDIVALEFKNGSLSVAKVQAARGKQDEQFRSLLLALSPRRAVLAYVKKGVADETALDDSFEVNGMNLYMSPLQEEIGGELYIPGAFTRLEGTNSSIFIYRDGVWSETRHMGAKKAKFSFYAKLPLGYENVKTKEIIIDFAYTNQSGNILVNIEVNGQKAEKGKDGLYRIQAKPNDIKNGKLKIDLSSKAKVNLTDNLEIHKANRWKVKHLKVGIKGEFNQQQKESRF